MAIFRQKESFGREKRKGRLLHVGCMKPVTSIQTDLSFNKNKYMVAKLLILRFFAFLFVALLHFLGKLSEIMSFYLNESYS